MARYLLDTCVLIEASRGWRPTVERLGELAFQGNELGICSVVVAEFYAGLRAAKRAEWSEFVDGFSYWPIGRSAAKAAGIWRFDYARRGQTLSLPDMLIAATAVLHGATLLTGNAKDFPMPGVTLERLTSS